MNQDKVTPKWRLRGLKLHKIDRVGVPDNPAARIVLSKAAPDVNEGARQLAAGTTKEVPVRNQYDEAVAELVEGGMSKADAMAEVAKRRPELFQKVNTVDAALRKAATATASPTSPAAKSFRDAVDAAVRDRVSEGRWAGLSTDAAFAKALDADGGLLRSLSWWAAQPGGREPTKDALAALAKQGMDARLVAKAFELE